MMKIKVNNHNEGDGLINPIDCWGVQSGLIYQQYSNGKPSDEYLIGAGLGENPISIWYDKEGRQWRISSETKESLMNFLSHIKYKPIDADFNVELNIL